MVTNNKNKKLKKDNFKKYILFVKKDCFYSNYVIDFLKLNKIKSKITIKKDSIENRKYILNAKRPENQQQLTNLVTFPALQIKKGKIMLESEDIIDFLEEKIINNLMLNIKKNIKNNKI